MASPMALSDWDSVVAALCERRGSGSTAAPAVVCRALAANTSRRTMRRRVISRARLLTTSASSAARGAGALRICPNGENRSTLRLSDLSRRSPAKWYEARAA